MEKIRFDDFIKLNRGFDLPDANIIEGVYPVVASTNIKAYHNAYKVEGPMVVTGRSGSLGTVQYIKGKCWPLNTSLYVKDFKGNYPKYVYYFLKTMHLEQYNAGAGVPTLNQNHLHSLKILIHPKEDQRRIAGILSAYDNLIENNARRIKLLEQMAEGLYKEWFVRFRFPGHEKAEFENGVPKGWKREKFGKIVTFLDSERIPLSSMERDNMEKIYPYYGAAALMDYVNDFIFDGVYLLMGEDGSVISNGQFPMLQYVWGKIWVNNHAHVLQGKAPVTTEYLYMMLKSLPILDVVTGVAQPKISQGRLSSKTVIIPSNEIVTKWSEMTKSMFEQIRNITEQNQLLTRQRDLLLPRLMSGKLEVGE